MPFDIDYKDTPTWRKAILEAQLKEKFDTEKCLY